MPATIPRKRTPEELLQQVQAEETYERRGKLKVFLGYASGVGKSFRMLDEGRRRSERGQDVVVGAIQPRTSPDIDAVLSKLQVIPLRNVDGVPVMDLTAILARHPAGRNCPTNAFAQKRRRLPRRVTHAENSISGERSGKSF